MIDLDGRGVNVINELSSITQTALFSGYHLEPSKQWKSLWCRRASEDRATMRVTTSVLRQIQKETIIAKRGEEP